MRMKADVKKLDRVFNPSSVAVVGDKQQLNYMWLRSLSTFQGRVYSVQIDEREILKRVSKLPVSRWNYKADDPGIQHIGPTAQDFRRLFEVGGDDKSMSTVDPAGVALAAIKGLHEKTVELERKTAEIDELKRRIEELSRLVEELRKEDAR